MRLARGKAAWDLAYRSGLAAAIGRRYGGIGAAFLFHHVVHDVSARLNDDLYVSAAFLEAWLTALRRAGVDVISLDEAVGRIRDPARRRAGRRFVVITFDDGYADNVECALPVLERLEAPFTVYVTTDLVEGRGYLWWLGLERLIEDNAAVDVAPMGRRFSTVTFREKVAALEAVTRWVWSDVGRRAPRLRAVFERYGVSPSAAAHAAGLSREQLRVLGRHPLATVGGHTSGHAWLAGLSETEAYREMSDNKTFLENVCGRPVEHFAYPHGAGGAREAALAERAGFETAVTNRVGCLFPAHRGNLRALPRHPCGGSRMWLSFMHAQRHGMRRFVESRGGCPVVTL